MTIDDRVLAGRIPRLGTITVGRGVEATSRSGSTYARPSRAKTLVVHTNDPEAANAVQVRFGGDIKTDSPTWDYDVVTDVRQMDVTVLPAGFRQSLELWRAAECLRRCDGVTMSTYNGRPTNRGCLCDEEMESGAERSCRPSTVLPVLLALDVERFGVWEVRSNAWGTAAAVKGAMAALTLAGSGATSVPAILSMVDTSVRDAKGEVHEVSELHVTIAQSLAALSDPSTPALPVGPAEIDDRRASLLFDWSRLQQQAHAAGITDQLKAAWRARGWAGVQVEELSDHDLYDWLGDVAAAVEDAQAAGDAASARKSAADTLPGVT